MKDAETYEMRYRKLSVGTLPSHTQGRFSTMLQSYKLPGGMMGTEEMKRLYDEVLFRELFGSGSGHVLRQKDAF
ncbi:MAG: hypothetical protein ACYSWY_00005 [Planctomycetota bacterium]|jgi:hypothetical protein